MLQKLQHLVTNVASCQKETFPARLHERVLAGVCVCVCVLSKD